MLRHGRPSLWANRELSRITVAECFGCRIWIIANWQLTASTLQPRAAFTGTPSINPSLGTAPSPGWPSIASWLFATACVSNPVVRKRNMPAFLCDSIIIWTRIDWYGANSYLDLANYRCSNLRGVCSDVGVSNH